MFEPGDIVLIHRNKYQGPFKYLITRLILFFTTEWWKGEKASEYYHAEMIVRGLSDAEFTVVTMEPPKCRFKERRINRKAIFRLKIKPPSFNRAFDFYVMDKLGQKYDFVKFLLCGVDWIFRTTWFTRTLVNPSKDICSEFVARFYEDYIGIPCSGVTADSTKPDEIFDFCKSSGLFLVVSEDRI